MSDFVTHVAAIGIGVAITLYLVGGFNGSTATASDAKKGGSSNGSANANANANANASAPKKRNRKKTKKKVAAVDPPVVKQQQQPPTPQQQPEPVAKQQATDSAPVVAAPVAVASSSAAAAAGGKKNKKKKNKKQPAAVAVATKPTATAVTVTAAPATAPAATVPAPATPTPVPFQPRAVVQEEEEAWETIPSKSKKKKNAAQKKQQAAAAAASSGAAAAAAFAAASVTVTIDASRVGIVIGPKGATMNSIQEKTGTKLDVNAPAKPEGDATGGNSSSQFRPVVNGNGNGTNNKAKATVVITEGTSEMQQAAKRAVLELADRGYATLLQAEGFGESSVSVHPRFLAEIVGSGGKTIKAIQTALDIKLTIPKTEWSPKQMQIGTTEPACRIGIAGDVPASVKTAKQVIRDLCQYHHHEITHPGFVHQEINVPTEFFHCVIGTRGSEIKHIRGNYKVEVYMPSKESWCTTENVLCVGNSNDVEKAIGYIKLLMDRDTELREQKYSDEHFGDDAEGW